MLKLVSQGASALTDTHTRRQRQTAGLCGPDRRPAGGVYAGEGVGPLGKCERQVSEGAGERELASSIL